MGICQKQTIKLGEGTKMSYKLSQKEYDALQIAGFSSVEELLARYFHLLNIKRDLEGKINRMHAVDAIGSKGCKLNVGHTYD